MMRAVPVIYDERLKKGLVVKGQIKPNLLRSVRSSVGIAFPFQPTLWNDKVLNEELENAKQLVQDLLQSKFNSQEFKKMLNRVEDVFRTLNFDTHRKSVAILLGPDDEKIIYLDFPVAPTVVSGENISLLDLIDGIEGGEEFYLMVIEHGRRSLYEINDTKHRKVYEQLDNGDAADSYSKTHQIIELLNTYNEKPVFVTGQPNLVELFCSNPAYSKTMFTMLYDYSSFDTDRLKSYTNEIIDRWDYWYSKFLNAKILIAQQTNSLITNLEAVTAALTRNTNGLLLFDRLFFMKFREKEGAREDTYIKSSFLKKLEIFLARGNRVIFIETGLLKYSGGVALLLQHRSNGQDMKLQKKHKHSSRSEIDFRTLLL